MGHIELHCGLEAAEGATGSPDVIMSLECVPRGGTARRVRCSCVFRASGSDVTAQ